MNFSEAVKDALDKKSMRPAELARQTGYSSQYILDLISGERRWNEDTINKVCCVLEIGIRYENQQEVDSTAYQPSTGVE